MVISDPAFLGFAVFNVSGPRGRRLAAEQLCASSGPLAGWASAGRDGCRGVRSKG